MLLDIIQSDMPGNKKYPDSQSILLDTIDVRFFIHARCCPSSLAKLVQITPISLWFMVDISILTMAVKKKTITGGHHLASTLVDA